MQLKVIKADGTIEGYSHTKVIAMFVNALVEPAQNNISVACELAEAVTFYLYNKHDRDNITSSEILSIIQAVLSSTGYYDAAANLAEHHYSRNLLRTRIEVAKFDIQKISDAVRLRQNITPQPVSSWNKSKIINDLIAEYNFDNITARIIASMVEEKILASGLRRLPSSFIRFLVLIQAQAILSAQQQLQSDEKSAACSVNNAVRDERLRQPQNGLCPVEV
jgi:hypothetical protein